MSNSKNSQHIKVVLGKNSFTSSEQTLEIDYGMRRVMSSGILKGSRFVTWECQGSICNITCIESELTRILLLNITLNYFIITVK